ncbi:MAG: ATP-binding protein [Deltaproteobacteria bacterium]|nr:ATP-binding protein [Deltaproteobacteria bacterium]
MVFMGGPRQVGKTTLALSLLKPPTEKNPAYLNWDILAHQKAILRGELPLSEPLIVLDELHKYARWRNLLKGLYDEHKSTNQFLVTGSARLDYFSKGGDSLLGRYHYYRLHPFSLRELNSKPTLKDAEHLLAWGGFPEPLFSGNSKTLKRWQNERNYRIVHEDLTGLQLVKELSLLDLLMDALPSKVGSPLSVKSLAEDLQVSHATIERWLVLFENFYVSFRIPPFGSPRIRAVKKEQKLYLWEWSQIEDPGARFENMVALQLLKFCHYQLDTLGERYELRYLRDTDKREIDFVVLHNKKPVMAVECKFGGGSLSPHIKYFKERVSIPRLYQVHMKEKDFGHESTGRVLPFWKFCQLEKMP